jgi:hypothetical protein
MAAGQYLNAVWPTISPRTAALVLLAAAALTMVGIRFNAAVTAALLALELTIILVVSALGFAHAHWSLAGTLIDPPVCAADGSAAPATLRMLLPGRRPDWPFGRVLGGPGAVSVDGGRGPVAIITLCG